jgi:hypothetical protein
MIEATTNPNARNAMEKAHKARSEALSSAWAWLFPRTSR